MRLNCRTTDCGDRTRPLRLATPGPPMMKHRLGGIAPRTSWVDLESQRESTTFEIATSWDKVVDPDSRVRKSRKVIRFTVAGHRLAAIRIYRYGSDPGVWCSTLTQEESDSLPGDGFATWLDIRRYGSDIEVAASWTDMS